MLSAVYLVFIACISTHAANIPVVFSHSNTTNKVYGYVYQNLGMAEQIIKSTKEKILKSMPALLPADCEDVLNEGENKSGVYSVWPKNRMLSGPIPVYCDMETDGGGWTVIQRRGDYLREKDYFFKDWNAYKEGFGNLKEDFWLGNDNIYALSNLKPYSVRIDLRASEEDEAYAVYDNFWIDDENTNYTLHVSGYRGSAGDSFSLHNGCKFSTKDRDNDKSDKHNCAHVWKGAWWFKKCYEAHLNGLYYKGESPKEWEGIIWKTWKGSSAPLAATEMKIRPTRSWIR